MIVSQKPVLSSSSITSFGSTMLLTINQTDRKVTVYEVIWIRFGGRDVEDQKVFFHIQVFSQLSLAK